MQVESIGGPKCSHRDKRDHNERTCEPECLLRPGRQLLFILCASREQLTQGKSRENWKNQNPRMLGSQRETGHEGRQDKPCCSWPFQIVIETINRGQQE